MKTYSIPGIANLVSDGTPIYQGSHFAWGEATMFGTRIPTQTTYRGVVIPATKITANIIALAKELDKIRSFFGDRPIQVNSWYRPPAVNQDVGGSSQSHHLLGWGVDIVIAGLAPFTVEAKLAKFWQGGLGKNRKYTHLDLRHLMGFTAARWDYGIA